jgi:hypothetical protein
MSLTATISSNILGLNATVNSQVLAALSSTLTPSQIAAVTPLLAPIYTSASNAAIQAGLQTSEATIQNKITSGANAQASINQDIGTINQSPPSIQVQDGSSSLKKPEMPVISKTFTNVQTAAPVASNALADDYPNTYGHTDDAQNWFKVNKTTGYTEFVHNSGCSLKIDRAGNVSVHIVGNLKWIIDNDMLLNILKNLDIHAMASASIEAAQLNLGY